MRRRRCCGAGDAAGAVARRRAAPDARRADRAARAAGACYVAFTRSALLAAAARAADRRPASSATPGRPASIAASRSPIAEHIAIRGESVRVEREGEPPRSFALEARAGAARSAERLHGAAGRRCRRARAQASTSLRAAATTPWTLELTPHRHAGAATPAADRGQRPSRRAALLLDAHRRRRRQRDAARRSSAIASCRNADDSRAPCKHLCSAE